MSLKFNEMSTGGKKAKTEPTKPEDRIPPKPIHARIVSIIDFGLQPQTDYETKEPTDPKPIIQITYETPTCTITYEDKEGNEVTKPRWISKDYMVSLSEMSNLYKLRKALNPKAESLDEFLNMPVLLTIGSTEPMNNAKVTGVSPAMEGFEVPPLANDAFHFDFSHPNMELFNGLLAWQQKKVKEALDYNGFADTDAPASTGTNDF